MFCVVRSVGHFLTKMNLLDSTIVNITNIILQAKFLDEHLFLEYFFSISFLSFLTFIEENARFIEGEFSEFTLQIFLALCKRLTLFIKSLAVTWTITSYGIFLMISLQYGDLLSFYLCH